MFNCIEDDRLSGMKLTFKIRTNRSLESQESQEPLESLEPNMIDYQMDSVV